MNFGEAVQEFYDWVVTVPKNTNWDEYLKELVEAHKNGGVANYRVANFPKNMRKGDKCYVVHDGKMKGWMEITGQKHWPDGFKCDSTGTEWPPGKYIQRSCKFNPIDGPEMKGFQGIRRKP